MQSPKIMENNAITYNSDLGSFFGTTETAAINNAAEQIKKIIASIFLRSKCIVPVK